MTGASGPGLHRRTDAPRVAFTTRRSRIGCWLELGVALLLACVALERAWVLEHPWPLLAATAGALLLSRLRVRTPARLEFVAGRCRGLDEQGRLAVEGAVSGSARCSALAIELCVADVERGRTRIVLWRDALTEADFRHLSRALRLGAAAVMPSSTAPALGGGEIKPYR